MTTQQTQTSPKTADKKPAPVPAAATTAAPSGAIPKTDIAPKTDTAPLNNTDGTDAAAAEAKNPPKVYIVVGEIHEFKSFGEAEKFLNKSDDAPKGDFTVIKGKKIEKKAKVSLR